MIKMTKKEQLRIANDFNLFKQLSASTQIQDVLNTKALDEYDEPDSYAVLYEFDDLLWQMRDTITKYINLLKQEQKIIPELSNAVKDL